MRGSSPRMTAAGSFDDLVGEREQGRRYVDAEQLGCLQVDHELEPGRADDRQVGGALALEDTARIDAELAVQVRNVWSVAHQPAGCHRVALTIDRRHGMTRRKPDDLSAPLPEQELVRDCERVDP